VNSCFCAGKQRYGNREKFEVMFQFRGQKKRILKKEKEGTKDKKRDLEERQNGDKQRYKGRKKRNIKKWVQTKDE
jgi:hypothetical protein